MYGFITAFFTQSFWWGYALILIVVHAFLFTADHANDDPQTLLILQVWWTFTYPFGAAVGLFAAWWLSFRKLVSTPVLINGRLTRASVGTFVFVWAWLIFFAGINFVNLRFSKTGISPIGGIEDSVSIAAGITLLTVFAFLALGATVYMADSRFPRANVNIKYLWIMIFLTWTGFIHDALDGDLDRPGPGGLMLAVLVAVILLTIPLIYYIPGPKLDPYYRNIGRTLFFLGIFALILLSAQITGWITNNVSKGDHIAVFTALVIYSVVIAFVIFAIGLIHTRQQPPKMRR